MHEQELFESTLFSSLQCSPATVSPRGLKSPLAAADLKSANPSSLALEFPMSSKLGPKSSLTPVLLV